MSEGFSIKRIFGNPDVSADQAEEFEKVHISADGVMETEGQLAVDVFSDEEKIDILAPLAGVEIDDVSLKIENDIITISGKREKPKGIGEDSLVEECFWGRFSRSIILPAPAKIDEIKATFTKGVLHIEIPKLENLKTKVIKITKD